MAGVSTAMEQELANTDLPSFRNRIEVLAFINRVINSGLDVDSTLKVLMDSAIVLTGAERGFIVLRSNPDGELKYRVARNVTRTDLRSEEFQVSMTVVRGVTESLQAVLIGNASEHPWLKGVRSVRMFGLRSILCVPMAIKGHLVGVIYLDNRLRHGTFGDEDLEFMATFADQAAVAIDNAALQQDRNRIRLYFSRYVSPQVADALLNQTGDPTLGGSRMDVTILFADIDGFTPLAERLPPDDIMALLNDHFTRMVEIVYRHGGTVKQFAGDEVMVVFGAPIPDSGHCRCAIQAAMEMRGSSLQWQARRTELAQPSFSLKIGMHTGLALVGNVGAPERMEFAAVGDVVNTASRITGCAGQLGLTNCVLASREVAAQADGLAQIRDLGSVHLKGRLADVSLFELKSGEG